MLLVVFIGYFLQRIKVNSATYMYRRASNMTVFFVFGYIIFWVGVRDAFVDTAVYIARFKQTTLEGLKNLDFTFGSGWGFDVIEILFKTFISHNYHAWLMFWAIVTGVCIAVIFQRYS